VGFTNYKSYEKGWKMTVKLSFTKQELMVMREAIHSITIKGSDAVLVGAVLGKIYKALDEPDKVEEPENSQSQKK